VLAALRGALVAGVVAGQRAVLCRLTGHSWTDMAYPPACSQCGRTQTAGSSPPEEGHALAA
jgi:hypothetical protein